MSEFCVWPLEWSDCEGCEQMSPEDEAKWGEVASEMLWNKTGRIFGLCPVTIRPCTTDCGGASLWRDTFWGRGPYPSGYGNTPWMPVLVGGKWTNVSCGCIGGCRCSVEGPTSLQLPGPVGDVTEVKINGQVIPDTDYRVMYHRILVRTDGERWPVCQNLLAADSEDDTFSVTYTRGVQVPVGGQMAAARLALEMWKADCGDDSCALPERLQTITRQGVTVGVFADADSWHETGIWMIDNWVASVLQGVKVPRATARSVDIPVRRSW